MIGSMFLGLSRESDGMIGLRADSDRILVGAASGASG